jgi:hypothetical protein
VRTIECRIKPETVRPSAAAARSIDFKSERGTRTQTGTLADLSSRDDMAAQLLNQVAHNVIARNTKGNWLQMQQWLN